MRRRTRALPAALACGLLLATSGSALAAQTQQLDTGVELLRQPPGKPWEIGLSIGVTIGAVGSEHPSPMTRMRFRFPHATVNSRAFPSCDLAKLRQTPVERTCPKRSRLGGGDALVDATFLMEPARIAMFNGQRRGGNAHFYFLALPEHISQTFVFDATLKKLHGGRYGYELSLDVPPIPTLPNNPDAAIVKLNVDVGAAGRLHGRRVPLLQAPTSCPRGGWRFEGAFSYMDGTTGTAASTIDCLLHGHS